MQFCEELVVGRQYFVVGYFDRRLAVPCIGTWFYLGIDALDGGTARGHRFQDARSVIAVAEEDDDEAEPQFVSLSEASLHMVADKAGLISWLQAEPSETTTHPR